MKIAVVGLGKCGLPFAAVANKYHEVVGIDVNSHLLNQIRRNKPFDEPLLNEYLEKYPLAVSTNLDVIRKVEVVFIFVDTKKHDRYVAEPIVNVLRQIKPYLNSQLIVVRSTLEPATSTRTILPFLKNSNMKHLCYNPTMVAIGSAIAYFTHPSYILIGQNNSEAGDICEKFYRQMYGNKVPVLKGSLRSAEIAKYVLNLALINRVALVNTLAEYCEVYGGSIDYIIEALKQEERVTGKKMLRAGLGLGGPSLPLDLRAYNETLTEQNLDTKFLDALMSANQRPIERVVEVVRMLQPKTVGFLGVTYKPGVPYLYESQAVEIAKKLARVRQVMVYDPQGMEEAKKELGDSVLYGSNVEDVLDFGEVIVVGVEWSEFSKIKADLKPHHIVVDPWRMFVAEELPCKYIAFGIGETPT